MIADVLCIAAHAVPMGVGTVHVHDIPCMTEVTYSCLLGLCY